MFTPEVVQVVPKENYVVEVSSPHSLFKGYVGRSLFFFLNSE